MRPWWLVAASILSQGATSSGILERNQSILLRYTMMDTDELRVKSASERLREAQEQHLDDPVMLDAAEQVLEEEKMTLAVRVSVTLQLVEFEIHELNSMMRKLRSRVGEHKLRLGLYEERYEALDARIHALARPFLIEVNSAELAPPNSRSGVEDVWEPIINRVFELDGFASDRLREFEESIRTAAATMRNESGLGLGLIYASAMRALQVVWARKLAELQDDTSLTRQMRTVKDMLRLNKMRQRYLADKVEKIYV